MSKALNVSEQARDDTTVFGFWVYLMTDCILFASLFATFVVLRGNTSGGPSGKELFSMPFVLTETLILLTSSFTCGLAILALNKRSLRPLINWLAVTFVLGIAFLGLELSEFTKLVHEGNSWQSSAFLSGFFTLVGTHGLHITFGLLWMLTLVVFLFKKGFNRTIVRRLTMLSLFWHFLDVVWIFIFTIVYLMGVV